MYDSLWTPAVINSSSEQLNAYANQNKSGCPSDLQIPPLPKYGCPNPPLPIFRDSFPQLTILRLSNKRANLLSEFGAGSYYIQICLINRDAIEY